MKIQTSPRPARRSRPAIFAAAPIILLGILIGYATPAVAQCERCDEARSLMEADDCKEAVKLLRKEAKGDAASAEAVGLLAICQARLNKAKDAAKRVVEFLKLESRPAQVIKVTDEVAAHVGKKTAGFITFDLPEDVVPPRLLVRPPVSYPQAAAELGLTADIIVDGDVTREGVARNLDVRELDDSVTLDEAGFYEAATNAILMWRFIPALANGVPIPAKMTCTIQFQVGE